MILLLMALFLTGCVSKESRAFMRDKEQKEIISDEIVRLGKETFHLEIEPNTKKMKFAWDSGFPMINDRSILVPVTTVGEPEFSFNAYVYIDGDPREITGINLDYGSSGLGYLGEFLIHHIYNEKHQPAFEQLKAFDSHVSIKMISVNALTSYHHQYEQEKIALYRAISADYNQGKFNDPGYYDQLLATYLPKTDVLDEPYYPKISLDVKQPYGNDFDMEEKVTDIINFIRTSDVMPYAKYTISATDQNDERIYEFFTKTY